MLSSEGLTDDQLRTVFNDQLAAMLAGREQCVPDGIGLDEKTAAALEAVGAAAPNPPATIIQAARVEFGKQLDGTHVAEHHAAQIGG